MNKKAKIKRTISAALFVMVIAVCTMVPVTSFADANNSINTGGAGMLGSNLKASAAFLEYERLLGGKTAILLRVGMADYKYDDSTYVEEGKPKGVDIGVRFYPMADKGMKGFFVGGLENAASLRTMSLALPDKD